VRRCWQLKVLTIGIQFNHTNLHISVDHSIGAIPMAERNCVLVLMETFAGWNSPNSSERF